MSIPTGADKEDMQLVHGIFTAYTIIAVVVLLFAVARLPIGVMVFDIPVMYMVDFALFVASIALIVTKSRMKKARKLAAASESIVE